MSPADPAAPVRHPQRRALAVALQVLWLLVALAPAIEAVTDGLDARCCRNGVCCCRPGAARATATCLHAACRCSGHDDTAAAGLAPQARACDGFALGAPASTTATPTTASPGPRAGFAPRTDHPPPY